MTVPLFFWLPEHYQAVENQPDDCAGGGGGEIKPDILHVEGAVREKMLPKLNNAGKGAGEQPGGNADLQCFGQATSQQLSD